MKPISPTPYTDVNEILDFLLVNVKEILQDQFVGMYLYGSLSSGDFNPETSDIDFLVVTTDEISEGMFPSLQAMHARLANMDSPWATQMEVSYIPQKALRRFDPADKLHPHRDRGTGESLHWMAHESDWIIQRHILRERGIIMEGPAPQSLIDPISATDLQKAVVDVLPLWATPILEDPLQIRSRGYQSFIVLSLCRMLYTLQCGTIISKRAAVDWAQGALGQQWTTLITRAWLGRQNAGSDAHAEDVDGTLNFIRYTMEYSRKMEVPTTETQNIHGVP